MTPPALQISYTLSELPEVVASFQAWAGPEVRVIAFSGNLGAGKTTFIRELCRQWGVVDAVSSPTFSLVNEYRTGANETVYHMDFYRLRSAEEAFDAGLEELLNETGAWVLVEWPEVAQSILPSSHIQVQLDSKDPDHRTLHAQSA